MKAITFRFIHPETNEMKEVDFSYEEVERALIDDAYEALAECNCEPIGETNVVECNCEDSVSDFRLSEIF